MPAAIDNPVFARVFHRLCGRVGGRAEDLLRDELLAGLRGRVVEVGPGDGVNFAHYPPTVTELVAVEPEPYMRRQAQEAARRAPIPVRVVDGLADDLGLDDAGFDGAVACGVLCSVPDQAAALAELRRVLAPGGELRFYEHVRSRRPRFAAWQSSVDPVWSRMMGGCHTDRDTLAAIADADFAITRARGFGFPALARIYPVAPRILGVATR